MKEMTDKVSKKKIICPYGQLLSSFVDAVLNNLEEFMVVGPITFEVNTEAGTVNFSVMPK